MITIVLSHLAVVKTVPTHFTISLKVQANPLVVRFDHGFMRPNLENNIKKLSRKLGFDMINFTPN